MAIKMDKFTKLFFDNYFKDKLSAEIHFAILQAISAASHMRGSLDATYKRLQQFSKHTDLGENLLNLSPDNACYYPCFLLSEYLFI